MAYETESNRNQAGRHERHWAHVWEDIPQSTFWSLILFVLDVSYKSPDVAAIFIQQTLSVHKPDWHLIDQNAANA